MKKILVGTLCAVLLTLSMGPAPHEAFPARLKLTCTTTNAAGAFVKTSITEKDIIARCASDNSVDPSRLRFVFINGELDVVDIVSTNLLCQILSFQGDIPTNVTLVVAANSSSNAAKVFLFSAVNSLGDGVLPADLAGSAIASYTVTLHSNVVVSATLKGTIQAGSVSNNTIYTGTATVGGKPLIVAP